jgi:hypothetical protein
MADEKSFVLNDETQVNCYGFRVKNAGLDLSRFKSNPVILAQHANSIWTVIGRWENIRIEGSLLLADPVFDTEDPDAAKIAGKVSRGFLKGASLGLKPATSGTNFNFKKGADGVPDLLTSEALEASIVAIPANKNSVRLLSAEGAELSEGQIKLSLNSVTYNPENNMEKFTLSAQAIVSLGLPNADSPLLVSAAIEKLATDHNTVKAELAAEKAKSEELQKKVTETETANARALVDTAINAGKLGADQREHYLAFATSNAAACAAVLNGMIPRTNLAGTVQNPSNGGQPVVKTMDEFEKLSLTEQLSFKTDQPEAYQKLFNS